MKKCAGVYSLSANLFQIKINKSFYANEEEFSKVTNGKDLHLSDTKTYYADIEIKIVWCWQKQSYRKMEQNKTTRKKPTHLWSTDF